MISGHDAFLHYNVGDWENYGLAIPNFGNDPDSQNSTVRYLVEVTGRNLQAVMWQPDAMLRSVPTINTLTRLHKLCTRARSILSSRAVPPGKLNMESAHAIPAREDFLVFPVPYFKVRNGWLKEYAGLVLTGLTDAMQHQENARPLEISTDFASAFGQYFQRIYIRMCVELLRIPQADAEQPDFTLTQEQLSAYNPSLYFTSTELIDTVPREFDRPTEDDLEVLTNGIPCSVLPKLNRYPAGNSMVGSASSGSTAVKAAGDGARFFAPPGV